MALSQGFLKTIYYGWVSMIALPAFTLEEELIQY